MVKNITILPANTRAHEPHIIVAVRARTIGKANADKTSPDVKKAQISFSAEESPPSVYLFVISVGSGERK